MIPFVYLIFGKKSEEGLLSPSSGARKGKNQLIYLLQKSQKKAARAINR
jgi:hypothetical protein